MINKVASLTPQAYAVLRQQATEAPHSGQYLKTTEAGTYLCRQCGLALFRSSSKFLSGCGWPSFDDELAGTICRLADPDQLRTEICCQRCAGHLGHVFIGETLTAKDQRHCVNSLAIDFVANTQVCDSEEAIVAGGCFWGIEHLFQGIAGILATQVGYIGGQKEYPSYQQVCHGDTGHIEAVRILFNPKLITYKEIYQYFFEIHDSCQENGQGADIGEQYQSAIFYYDATQKEIAVAVINFLRERGMQVMTRTYPVSVFWPAESYHQHYYQKNGKQPYCHFRRMLFDW